MTQAIYAASLDPIHYGHIDIIERAGKAFDEIIVAIGVNPGKKDYTFNLEERVEMARKSLLRFPHIRVEAFKGLLVDYAYEQNIKTVVKGARNSADFDYEKLLHQIGESQKLGIDSFVLFSKPGFEHMSSTAVKGVVKEQGKIEEYVPLFVKQKLEERINRQYIVGISGEIGAGKSFVADQFVHFGKEQNIEVYNIEFDRIGHSILGKLVEPAYQQVREKIIREFGESVRCGEFIDRKTLGEIVFSDNYQLQKLNEIMRESMDVRLRRELTGKKGLILINAALIAESGMSYLCNNNVLLVGAEKDVRNERLRKRGLCNEQIERRNASQYTFRIKKEKLEEAIRRDNAGKIWTIENNTSKEVIEKAFEEIKNYFIGEKK